MRKKTTSRCTNKAEEKKAMGKNTRETVNTTHLILSLEHQNKHEVCKNLSHIFFDADQEKDPL